MEGTGKQEMDALVDEILKSYEAHPETCSINTRNRNIARQKISDSPAMRHMIFIGQIIAKPMRQRRPCMCNRHPRYRGCQKQPVAVLHRPLCPDQHTLRTAPYLHTIFTEHMAVICRIRIDITLDEMSQRIDRRIDQNASPGFQ